MVNGEVKEIAVFFRKIFGMPSGDALLTLSRLERMLKISCGIMSINDREWA
ncbi:unnamed protein product [Meloidogyne enterolobii]|uniref:Uncharacterized protein n=1 Tax=Meloidogyne enterolobii TaxID=390850 RepID=A0ACB0Z0R1_MELEN